ncbi:helix-turn-helix domain-containing protein [Streptomyces aurantiacus]|uniref:Putative HTH-type transcriptional activator HxlR n=1 Tax=Streptomyces aurantiacus JA 4570 TaxID=1286094 RepID=S3ZKA8_9ACTN|nr:helix-turn-helix domain-containing protein [Streptomyces aurantiacus]EPH44001.1 putative HTH-type transcriptional activator HxlR [Streptomyces aurantiacus JA 4570]
MAHRTVSNGLAAPREPRPGLPDDPRARVTAPTSACPVEVTLAALRGRWTTLVVRELLDGDVYAYSELAAALPQLSDKVLAERLVQLVEAGVARRTRTPGWPSTVTYRLTPHGRELGPVLQALWDWGAAAPVPGQPREEEEPEAP